MRDSDTEIEKIEKWLIEYSYYLRTLRARRAENRNILHESPKPPESERTQSSKISNITMEKAIRMINLHDLECIVRAMMEVRHELRRTNLLAYKVLRIRQKNPWADGQGHRKSWRTIVWYELNIGEKGVTRMWNRDILILATLIAVKKTAI